METLPAALVMNLMQAKIMFNYIEQSTATQIAQINYVATL